MLLQRSQAILFLNFYYLAEKLKGRLKISFQTAFNLRTTS